MTPKPLLCGVELGGTKCECLVGTAPDDIRERITLKTESDAAATLGRIARILRDWKTTHGTFSAIGLACFGPLELRPESPNFGKIGMTPKEGWRNVDVAGFFASRFADAVGITTDVIAAALAEGRWGAGSEGCLRAIQAGFGLGSEDFGAVRLVLAVKCQGGRP